MDYTKSKGNITELTCLIGFMSMGFDCSIPYGDNSRYDIIVDVGDELLRVQCKSSSNPIKNGIRDLDAFHFSTVTQTTNTKETVRKRYDESQIDYFATAYDGKVYLIPVSECSTSKTLRLKPPTNGSNVYNKAEDYLLENMLGHKVKTSFCSEECSSSITESTIAHKEHICVKCHRNPVSKDGIMCVECYRLSSRKTEWPSKEELKELIRTKSFVQIGKDFGVSDNAVRRWCKSYNLPTRMSDIKSINSNDWTNL